MTKSSPTNNISAIISYVVVGLVVLAVVVVFIGKMILKYRRRKRRTGSDAYGLVEES